VFIGFVKTLAYGLLTFCLIFISACAAESLHQPIEPSQMHACNKNFNSMLKIIEVRSSSGLVRFALWTECRQENIVLDGDIKNLGDEYIKSEDFLISVKANTANGIQLFQIPISAFDLLPGNSMRALKHVPESAINVVGWEIKPQNPVFRYHIKLIKPAESNELSYKDNLISISFKPNYKQLAFQLKNESTKPIRVIWNEASFVDVESKAHKIIHKGIKFIDKEKAMTATTIPPEAILDDLIAPIDLTELVDSEWKTKEILPRKRIADLKGKVFSFFLPLVIGNIQKDYLFKFEIDAILVSQP